MADADFSVKAIISAQTSQFEKGMKNAQSSVNSLSSSISNITSLVKKAFKFTGIAVGTKSIVDFGKSCVQEANEAIKTFKILDNTVKATGADAWTSIDKLENASKTLSDSTNYSVTEIQHMQSVLLGFTNITGEAFDGASEAVLDMATVMGMDLTSAVQTIGKALDDPITGLDSLRRQGFKFTDEQKAELAQLVTTGKQLEAQKIILDTLAISYGGASKAGQDSFAKQRHAVEDLQEAIGVKLIPVMQVFAENNTQMINSLRKLIENMDFTPVVNVVTNLSKIFDETFNKISEVLQKVGAYVSDFITRFNFKPIIPVLDGLLGGLSEIISKFKEINSQKLEIFDKLKESLIDFSNSETFQNIVDFVNKIIDAVFFLWSEIQDVVAEIRNFVVNKIIEIWGKIKELFEKSQGALANSGQDIASWGDLFYDILNNAFRSFQDFFGMIKALIHGDWAVAWEYAKLTVMRIADNILDIFSTIANAFPDLVNKFLSGWNWIIKQINKARKLFGQDPLDLADTFESTDLSKKTGLEDKIKETEDKIRELTGKSADITTQNLTRYSTEFAGFTQRVLGYIHDLTEGVKEETGKQKEYYSSATSDIENSYKAFSEWDSKLLKQRQNNLSEYSKEYHEINLQLIEEERKKALENEKNENERTKINKYYNNEIEEENKRFEEDKREKARETFHIIMAYTKTFLQDTIAGFKKVADTFKKVLSGIGNFVKNIFSGLKNIFSTLFDFNIDDTLNNLLKIEDAILTFFVETLPRLPNFFESAFTSVLTLIQTLINSIDWDNVKNILDSIIKTFVTYAPQIMSGMVEAFTNLVSTVSAALVENAPEIVSAIGEMFFTILEALPSIISNFIKVVGTYLSEIGKYFTDNFDRLSEDLSNIIKSLIDGIAEFISSGGWKNLLDGLLAIQKAIENAIIENIDEIVNTIADMIPDLIEFLKNSIVSASKTLGKLAPKILPLIADLINAIIEVITSDEVSESFFDALEGIVEGLIVAIIKLFTKGVPKLLNFAIKLASPQNLMKIVIAIVKGLVKAFAQINWGEVVYDIFIAFIDGIKDLFGIHSPSTLFEEFGTYMVEGLVNGLKGIAEAVMIILQPLINAIQSLFSGLFSFISDVIGKILDAVTSINQMSFDALEKVIGGLIDSIGKISDSLTAVTKISFDALNKSIGTVTDSLTKITELSFGAVSDLADISFETLKTTLSSVSDVLKTISSTAVNLVDVSFKGLKDIIDSIGNSVTNITNSVASLVRELKGLVEAVNKGLSALNPFSGGSSSGSGSSGSSGESTVKRIIKGILTGGLSELFRHANGTNNAPAGLSLVGEAGPELVKFRGGEQVLNNRNTQKALANMGGTTINQNVTFNNLQDTSAFTMIQQLKQYNRQMAINGII